MMIFKWEFCLDEQKSPQNNTKNNAVFTEYLRNICGIFAEVQVELLTFC